jgi:hypothetical protein
MKEYQKIETLYSFDSEIKRFRKEFYNPIVEYLKDCKWFGTEKIDGTNIRILWNGHSFEFGGRTDNAEIPKAVMKILTETFNYDMEVLFEQKFGEKETMLFMEAYAGKIQNGAYEGPENIIGFDIMIGDIYLDKTVSKQIFEELGLKFVPVLEFNNLQECIDYVHNNKQSIIQPQSKIEGLVCYPAVRLYDHQGKRIIVKIKNKDLSKLV